MEGHSITSQLGRFAALLSDSSSARPLYDEILLNLEECVVTPTLGSIIPNWLLVIPRIPVTNFAYWSKENKANPYNLIQSIVRQCCAVNDQVFWFEHGASETGSAIGCGVDQAHIHVVVDAPFSFDAFISHAIDSSHLAWESASAEAAYQMVDTEHSYLVAGTLDRAFTVRNVERVGSQFFRRIISDLSNSKETWNYKTHPHVRNIEQTFRRFRGVDTRTCCPE